MKSFVFIFLTFFFIFHSAAQPLTLEEFIARTHDQNLELRIEQAKLESFDAKSIGLIIPPPMLGFSQMKEEDGSKANGFEIYQTIPFPTKLFADHAARNLEFKSQAELRLVSQRQILLNAKLLYFSLWQSQNRLSLLFEKKDVLREHLKISRSVARSDSFTAIHVLKAESDFDLLDNEIESTKQFILEKQFEMANFINSDPASFKVETVEPRISNIPKIDSFNQNHLYYSKQFTVESLKAKENLAKLSWLPDFNLRYKEMGSTSTSMKYNEFMIGITLPFVFFWEPYTLTKLASHERQAAEYGLEKEKINFRSDQAILLSRAESLRRQIETLSHKLIPRAEKRMKLVHNLAPRDLETLQDHRETMEAFPELKMRALVLRVEYEKAVAELEKYASDEGPQR